MVITNPISLFIESIIICLLKGLPHWRKIVGNRIILNVCAKIGIICEPINTFPQIIGRFSCCRDSVYRIHGWTLSLGLMSGEDTGFAYSCFWRGCAVPMSVPPKWDSSPKQVGLQSQAGGTGFTAICVFLHTLLCSVQDLRAHKQSTRLTYMVPRQPGTLVSPVFRTTLSDDSQGGVT